MADGVGYGNLWTGDSDSEGFRELANVSTLFGRYVQSHLLWVQDDPRQGWAAKDERALGKDLVRIGRAMQENADDRSTAMQVYGPDVLHFLADLNPDERVALDEIATRINGATFAVEMAVNDLVRAGAIDAWRGTFRPKQPLPPTLFAITPKGRELVGGEAPSKEENGPRLVEPSTQRPAIGAGDSAQQ
ncbi:hypothetical protein UK23_23780 [Lentzea aerocolonigenes]|uniref:Uncharacterized protein n=1 Tax=Lentzea aerocolonigenes TaxID=68170 RepID=A0A0F0GUT3_LENAE|nr:hypothetical protein [Lentzea aerocolonigenes]KJK46341.1 hypothetical protein UK23_23780 [Lentzea aerocolonigenes]